MNGAHKGLDLILGKIKESPGQQTLVSRYLALVAELVEPEKSGRALDLAQLLVKTQAGEALKIAHMVYRSDHANLRALDVMIASLSQKGRFGKAEVLRIERAKIVKAKARNTADMEAMSEMSLAAGDDALASQAFAAAAMESSRIAELDLGSEEGESQHSGMLEALFPVGSSSEPRPEAEKPPKLALGSLAERPNDTVLPFRQGGAAQVLAEAPTIHLADQALPHTEPPPARSDRADIFEGAPVLIIPPPEVPVSPFAAVIELFDYYWRQGFVNEARQLLQQSAPAASQEAWWQARHAQVEKSKMPFVPKLEAADLETRVTLSPAAPTFWAELRDEMKRVAGNGKPLMVPLHRIEKLTKLFRTRPRATELPDEFLRALVEIDHRMAGLPPADVLNLKWNLFQGLWGEAPDLTCAEALVELGLNVASPAFFGLYLDALVAGGSPRKALVEIQRILPEKSQLAWANVAWRRLPLVFNLLDVHGFNWSEDDGVPALLALLKRRPRQKLAGIAAAR